MNTSTTGSLLFDGIIPLKKNEVFLHKTMVNSKKRGPVINRHYALENVCFQMAKKLYMYDKHASYVSLV